MELARSDSSYSVEILLAMVQDLQRDGQRQFSSYLQTAICVITLCR